MTALFLKQVIQENVIFRQKMMPTLLPVDCDNILSFWSSHLDICSFMSLFWLAAFLQRSYPLCRPQGCWGVCGEAAALLQGQLDRRHEPDRGQ